MTRANRLFATSCLVLPMLVMLALHGEAVAQPRPVTSAPGAAASSAAIPPAPSPALPPGHPPIDVAPIDTGDEDSEADVDDLPPGHPPIGSGGPPANMGDAARPRSFSVDDSSIPAGIIVVQARMASGKAPEGATARLKVRHQTVAAGTTTTEHAVALDAQGKARFTGQAVGSEWVYSVSIDYIGVPYVVPMFQLSPMSGKRVELSVYETTRDMDEALVGTQAFLYIEPQERAFQVEQLFRFSNLSDKTWRVDGMTVRLPSGFKALVGDEDHNGSVEATEVTGRGVRLSGIVAPGATQVVIRYQLPFPDGEQAHYEFGLPARVGHLRVIAAIPPSMGLRVDDLPPPQTQQGNDGRRLAITEAVAGVGDDQIEAAGVTITGLPTPSPWRWYALGLTLFAVVSGLAVAVQQRDPAKSGGDWETLRRAMERNLLAELEGLERARRAGEVGPRTYEQARRKLIDQLAAVMGQKPKRTGVA